MVVVEDRDGDNPRRVAPICRSGLVASRVGSPPGQVGDLVEGIPMLCVETLVEARLVVGVDFPESACGMVAPY